MNYLVKGCEIYRGSFRNGQRELPSFVAKTDSATALLAGVLKLSKTVLRIR